jgi:hypothetical protein
MHYQDADGAWQRIDPAFTAVANGWVNTTNAINTGCRRAAVRLTSR